MGAEASVNVFGEELAISWSVLGPVSIVAQNLVAMLSDFKIL